MTFHSYSQKESDRWTSTAYVPYTVLRLALLDCAYSE